MTFTVVLLPLKSFSLYVVISYPEHVDGSPHHEFRPTVTISGSDRYGKDRLSRRLHRHDEVACRA